MIALAISSCFLQLCHDGVVVFSSDKVEISQRSYLSYRDYEVATCDLEFHASAMELELTIRDSDIWVKAQRRMRVCLQPLSNSGKSATCLPSPRIVPTPSAEE